jgi:predicted phosphodiesterase
MLVPPSTAELTERVVFLSDIHTPYQDDRMVDAAAELVADIQPHRVVLNGDIADFFQLSRFNKGLDRLDTLQEELDLANEIRTRFRIAAPNAMIHETEGNHDSRLRTFVQLNARALTSLRDLKPERLNAWALNDIFPHGDNGFLLRSHFLVKHGNLVRGEAGASAKAECLAANVSGATGHTHKLAPYIKTGYQNRVWWEGGCLCRTDPDYVPGGNPNWQNGLLVGQFSTKSAAFVIEPVTRYEDSLIYGGKRY